MRSTPPVSRTVSRVSLILGGPMTAFGFCWCAKTAMFLARSEKTEGEIVRVERISSKGAYSPVFSYHDRSNHQWEGRPPISSSSFAAYRSKQKVSVVFDPAEPMNSNLDTFAANWWFPGMILTAGSCFLLVAWSIRKQENKDKSWR